MDDHLVMIAVLAEALLERSAPCWVAVLDFEKVFDSVKHEALWQSLDQGSRVIFANLEASVL